jgi:hypothetical protein
MRGANACDLMRHSAIIESRPIQREPLNQVLKTLVIN